MKTPTKTEYKGIQFKSKSEAMFARCLDLSSLVDSWHYEPASWNSSLTHPWDFSATVYRPEECWCCGSTRRRKKTILIEYKPSPPTDTYIKNLTDKCRPICDELKNGRYVKLALARLNASGGDAKVVGGRLVISNTTDTEAVARLMRIETDAIAFLSYGRVPMHVESYIVWGNPWTGRHPELDVQCGHNDSCYITYPIFTDYGKYGWGDFIQLGDNACSVPFSYRHSTWEVLGISQENVNEAMSYRFDLVDGDFV